MCTKSFGQAVGRGVKHVLTVWWCLLIFVFSLNVIYQLSTKINEIPISCLRGVAQTISLYDKSFFFYLKDLDNKKIHEDT